LVVTLSPEVETSLDTAFHIAKATVLPPLKLWFNWRLDGLDKIPPEGPVIVAGNHVSYVDPFVHGYFLVRAGRRPRFLAKSELFDIPVVGRVLRGAGQIPVHRGSEGEAPLTLAEAALGEGEAVVIYPEGTVTKEPDFRPMRAKTGTVRLALAAGVPITPVAVWGGQHVWQKEGRGDLSFGRPLWARAGEAMDLSAYRHLTNDFDLVRRLTVEVTAALSTLVGSMRAEYPKRWS
jgi:1-acyl-sn-glycerol-3-phosphate acyltransferase